MPVGVIKVSTVCRYRESHSLECPSNQAENIQQMTSNASSVVTHRRNATSHGLYIYSGVCSLSLGPALFKPPWAGLQLSDHRATPPSAISVAASGEIEDECRAALRKETSRFPNKTRWLIYIQMKRKRFLRDAGVRSAKKIEIWWMTVWSGCI